MVSSMMRQAISVPHSLHMAASTRTSWSLRSTSAEIVSTIDSRAKMSAAIRAIFSAMAACLPIGPPHCLRSTAHFLVTFRQRLENPTQAAGRVLRPVFKVVRATFQTFALGEYYVLTR